jgi:hypothetical protein
MEQPVEHCRRDLEASHAMCYSNKLVLLLHFTYANGPSSFLHPHKRHIRTASSADKGSIDV